MTIRKRYLFLLNAIFVATVVWWFVIWLSGSQGSFNYYFNLCTSFCGMFGAVLVFINSLKWRTIQRRYSFALLFFSLAIFAQSIGALVFSYYNFGGIDLVHFLHPDPIAEVPYPGVADFFYGIFPLAAVIGSIFLGYTMLLNSNEQRFSKLMVSLIVPFLVITICIFAFMTIQTVRPLDFGNGGFSNTFALDLYYNAGDSLVLALGSLLLLSIGYFKKEHLNRSIIFFVLGFISVYFADYFFFYRLSQEKYFIGDYPDLFYLLTLYFISLGGVLFSAGNYVPQPSSPLDD